jgi:hypothetical protein
MPVGGGAEDKVRQLEREVEQARRVLASKEQQLYAWQRGLDGERRTGEVLASLQTHGWAILHDLHWPGRPYANIDHIAIGPTGIFVIDSKNWSGDVIVRQGVLRQNGSRRSDACEGAAAATGAVAAFLEPQHRSLVRAVVCLVDQPTPDEQPAQARVLGLDRLEEYLTSGAPQLSAWDVGRISEYLRQLLSGPKSPAMKTTAELASAGVAPPEPVRFRSRRQRPPTRARRPVPTPRRRSRSSTTRGGDSIGFVLLKVTAILFFALVLVPRLVPAMTDQLAKTLPTSQPTVVQPAVTPTSTVPPTAKKSAPKGTSTSRSR